MCVWVWEVQPSLHAHKVKHTNSGTSLPHNPTTYGLAYITPLEQRKCVSVWVWEVNHPLHAHKVKHTNSGTSLPHNPTTYGISIHYPTGTKEEVCVCVGMGGQPSLHAHKVKHTNSGTSLPHNPTTYGLAYITPLEQKRKYVCVWVWEVNHHSMLIRSNTLTVETSLPLCGRIVWK